MNQHQQMSRHPDFRNFTLNFKQLGFCASPVFLQTLIFKWKAKCTFIWKEDFGLLKNSQFLFLLIPFKILLMMFLFQKMSERGDSWFTDSSFSSLLGEALPSVWIGFGWHYSQACGHPCRLCTFSYTIYSFQSTLYLICFDTALLEQPSLSVMTLCDVPSLWRVSIIIFWTITKSAVFPIIVVSKNKSIFWYWFLTFISCKL